MYVFERVIACFDSLGVLYLSVEEWRRNFQNKATERKGSEEGEGRIYEEEEKEVGRRRNSRNRGKGRGK